MNDLSAVPAGYQTEEIEYTHYTGAKQRLEQVLAHFDLQMEGADDIQRHLQSIRQSITPSAQVQPQQEALFTMQDEIDQLLSLEHQEIKHQVGDFLLASTTSTTTMRNSYETLLARLEGDEKPVVNERQLAYDFSFFSVDADTQRRVEDGENPYLLLLDNKIGMINGFANTLAMCSAAEFGMTESSYQTTRQQFSTLQSHISSFRQQFQPAQQTALTPKGSTQGNVSRTLMASDTPV